MLASTQIKSEPSAPLLARVERRYRPREEERPYEPKGAALALLLDRSPEVVLEGPAGTGKAQPLDAPVWTPTGARRMGDLAVGDLVLTPDGGVAPITAIPFRDMAPVYRVTFSDGAQVECSDGHLWTVAWRDSSDREHVQTLPLATLLAMGLRKRNGSRPRFWVPQTAPVALAAQPVPIPPYTLGVLLGDGYIRDGETSFTTADSAIADRVAAEMTPHYRVTAAVKAGNAASAYRIVAHGWRPTRGASGKAGYVSRTISGKWMARLRQPGLAATAARYIGSFDTPEQAQAAIDAQAATVFTAAQRAGVPGLSQTLEQLGLRNARSATKFVPEVYKQNSAAVRWEVLRGLMDTDGYADRTTVNFTSISRQLAEDVRWLVQSLGGTAHITTKQPRGGQLAYTVWIRLPAPAEAFHLERKRVKAGVRHVPVRRWVESVDFIGSQLCQCITVGTAEGLYLTDGFVVTHNSRALLEKAHLCACKYPGCRILLVRKTRESMTESCLVTYEEKVLPEGSPIAEGPKRDTRKSYQYPNGSTIVVAGLVASGKDQRAKVMSTEYDLILVFEATELSEHEYEQLTSRLRNGRMPYQQILSDCNPDIPTHWLHQRCDKGIARVHHSRHEDNPLLYRDGQWTARGQAYLATLDRMSGARRERLRFGRRAASEGLVYEGWDPGVHLLPADFPIPKEWTRIRVIDFGFTNPFVCFDDQTEVLTPQGWRLFQELPRDSAVATVNVQTHALEWQHPTAYIETWYEGEMVVAESVEQGANFSVTPNHRMVIANRRSGRWRLERADHLPALGDSAIPTGWEPVQHTDGAAPYVLQRRNTRGRVSTLSTTRAAFAVFLGLWLAEGCLYEQRVASLDEVRRYVRIAQKHSPERVRMILRDLGVTWTEHANAHGVIDFRIQHAALYAHLDELCGRARSAEKRLPACVWEWGADSLQALFDGLMLGDGRHRTHDDAGVRVATDAYYTTSRQLADDVQQLACLLGKASVLASASRATPYAPDGTIVHTVRFHVAKQASIAKLPVQRRPYAGYVRCVTVPNGTLVVRRGGRPMVCGNCQWWAIDGDRRAYRYREIYMSGRTVAEHIETIKRVEQWCLEDGSPNPERERIQSTIADHDAEDRQTLANAGISSIGAYKAVQRGIQVVQERLKIAGDGKPRLYLLKGVLVERDEKLVEAKRPWCTEQEFDGYRWPKGQDGKTVKEEPVKENDHGMDTVRYLGAQLDLRGGVGGSLIR